MPNPWFRLYSEFADDPKVQMMSESMQRRLVMLMCSRCKGETLQEHQIAFHWRISDSELADTKKVFLQNGFIDEDWELINWNRRQFVSDSSTDRVRRSRLKKKQDETLHPAPTSEEIISDETGRNVTVTAPEQNRTDSEADSEQTQRQKRPSVREQADEAARRISQAVNPEAHEDLSEWVDRIAVAYPRNRIKNLGPLEVYPADKPFIVDAVLLEAARHDVPHGEAAKGLLEIVESLGDVVPRADWHMLPRMTDYFAKFEYRRDPETFKRSTGARGGASNGKRRGTDGNAEALREFLATAAPGAPNGLHGPAHGDSGIPGATGGRLREDGDAGDVPALHGGAVGPVAGTDRPGVQSSDGGVPFVLPKPSYPPRVQWPRRNG